MPATARAPYEEAYAAPSLPRRHYVEVLEALEGRDLGDLEVFIADHLASRGVTFGTGAGRQLFCVDPVPRVLDGGEWAQLEAGIVQRVRALNAFVLDVYGERRIVREGIVPADVVDGADHHEPLLAGATFAGPPVVVAGLDIVRDPSGEFLVLEDNVRTPSGLAYAVAAREAIDRFLPAPPGRRAITGAFERLGAALAAAAPAGRSDPYVVLLSDGPANSAWYEHHLMARRLGLALVRPQDLLARSDGLYAREGGGSRRVDVVYRRTDEDRLTDERGELTPLGRLLLEPAARGQVTCANAFGTGVADDKLSHAYVEEMVRFYLGEEPRLRSVPTYDLRDDALREALLDRLDEIVVKPRSASGGEGILIGPHADAAACAAAAAAVRRDPHDWVAQETVWLSRHPTAIDGRLEPRHVDLRAFALTIGESVVALPGGLTRVARDAGALVVNSSQRGGGKDTWVLR